MKTGKIFKNWLTGEKVKITNVIMLKDTRIIEYKKSEPFVIKDERSRIIANIKTGAKPLHIFNQIYSKI